ncbi:Transcription factor [Saitoella coloradoensis]
MSDQQQSYQQQQQPPADHHQQQQQDDKKPKRRKVNHACVYCRRSHMTCDAARPCSRCVKRNIGHLCHDEVKDTPPKTGGRTKILDQQHHQHVQQPQLVAGGGMEAQMGGTQSPGAGLGTGVEGLDLSMIPGTQTPGTGFNPLAFGQTPYPFPQTPFTFASEYAGGESNVLNDFLSMIEDPTTNTVSAPDPSSLAMTTQAQADAAETAAKEKFFLTASDPSDASPEDRLKQVINAKLEAGFLKPFNYVKGYARLQKYMESHMSPPSHHRILVPLQRFRPAFRAVAQSLTDVDLILVEEAFERLLLDYDRVFTSISVPACLWRRTGEIFRGNKEFAQLIGVPVEMLRDGRLAIYELMAEDSAVNYWEKYGNIAFDGGQKAVLTSCILKTNQGQGQGAGGANGAQAGVLSCCFSFTIRRDRYNIPSCIIGNFIPINLTSM